MTAYYRSHNRIVVESLGLSYHNARELNRIIDEGLPSHPKFRCEEIRLGGESYDIVFRDVIPCIHSLFGDPMFARRLVLVPERHYRDPGHADQIFSEMHTGRWWWSVQQSLELRSPGATVVPVIISSDKTQLSNFRSKSAYPVYMTIGNIPRDIRRKPSQRAQMLLRFIPTTWLEHIKNKAARRRALANLFHSCMRKILAPIESYGETGIPMVTGNGSWHRCHPILTTFIGNYPEQCLVACTHGRCPKCTLPSGEFGSLESFPLRDVQEALGVFKLCDSDPTAFHAAARDANLNPTYHPFWEGLPFTNIFLSITPDVLHQLHQGIAKHLVRWLARLGSEEIDARCARLPPNHNARHFRKGITGLSRLTGREHKHICRIILGLIVDFELPDTQLSARLARAVQALLNFIYLAQYSVHSKDTLNALDAALCRFHKDKEVFLDLGVRKDFNFPKMHSLSHYRRSIIIFGTTDNYNTEQSERLHVDLTKKAFRKTNFKDEAKQMATHNERSEAIHDRSALMKLREGILSPIHPPAYYPPSRMYPFLAIHPSEKAVTFGDLANQYGAIDFQDALADFIVQHNYPDLSANVARRRADNTLIPFQKVAVFHKIKFTDRNDTHKNIVDVIHVRPEACNQRGTINAGRFDTCLVKVGSRLRVVQIRVVFQLSTTSGASVFLPSRPDPPPSLAYVEWFSLPSAPDPAHKMSRISRQYTNHGRRSASILPLTDICRSVQLFPVFGPVAPRNWEVSTVLEECQNFYINPFLDKHMYCNFSANFV
ncbi:hypothetical protein EI94DRAFT_1773137 [Lactarius quietus]|nr:hypothetical protein EI94DRAFT_1773137 [Lactarius quietus]